MRQNQKEKPPKIADSLSRAFLQPENTLILHSKGLEILPSLAQALYSQKSHLTILVDFPAVEIQELNYYLQEIKQANIILQSDSRSDRPEVMSLAKTVRQKRKKYYIQGGIYALTTQIMLLDCLSDSNDLNVGYIGRVVLRDGDYEANDKYGLTVWLATLLGMNKNKTVLTVASNKAHLFRGEKLEKIMRLLYMKKLVLWPFGRSQIHSSLQHSSVQNINHKLSLDETEKLLHQHFLELQAYCQKSPFDSRQVEYLCHFLLNYNKLQYLLRLQDIVHNSSEYSIWKSSNTNVLELVDKLVRVSRNCVVGLILCKQEGKQNEVEEDRSRRLNLLELVGKDTINGSVDEENKAILPNQVPYKLFYELHVPALGASEEKISPFYPVKLIQIIKQIKNNCHQLDKRLKQMGTIEEQEALIEELIARSQGKQTPSLSFPCKTSKRERIVHISTSNKQLAKQLHLQIFTYRTGNHYLNYLHRLYYYLHTKSEQRVNFLRKVIKRQTTSSKSNTMPHIQQEYVLMQELYLELKTILEIVQKHSKVKDDDGQREALFGKQVERLNLRYVDKDQLKLPVKLYGPLDDCILELNTGENLWRIRFCIQVNLGLSDLSQSLRVLAPHSVFFYCPNTSFIRHLNVSYSQDLLFGVQKIHTVYFANSIESDKVVKAVKDQDQSFWGIAQERKKLGQYMQNPEIRIKELIIDDQIHKKAKILSLAAATQAKNSRNELAHINCMEAFKVERIVLVDKRQFKSLLPSYLYHHGFKVIPVFLQNADYILSNQVGIEKKSVHTRDLHQSLKSGRLGQQIKRLCSKFSYPYLLIECPDLSYFKKEEFNNSYNRLSGEKYTLNLRKQLIQLLYRYPKINLIWSTSYSETIKYFIQLKKNRDEPDINKFKPQSQEEQLEILEQQKQKQTNLQSQF